MPVVDYNELPQARAGAPYVWYMPAKDSWTNRAVISLEYDFVQFAMPLDDMLQEIRNRHQHLSRKDKKIKKIVAKIKDIRKRLIDYYEIDYRRNKKLLDKNKPMASFLVDY